MGYCPGLRPKIAAGDIVVGRGCGKDDDNVDDEAHDDGKGPRLT